MKRLKALFNHWGVYEGLKGHDQTIYAMDVVMRYPDCIHNLRNSLYPAVCLQFRCSRDAVRKNIDYFIKAAWNRAPDSLSQLAQRKLYQEPTVKDFLCMLKAYLASTDARESG